jgi:hypothetical protein
MIDETRVAVSSSVIPSSTAIDNRGHVPMSLKAFKQGECYVPPPQPIRMATFKQPDREDSFLAEASELAI